MKIGIFGGSFNPIHNGHILIARQLLDLKVIDQVWLLPCYSHVWNKDLAPAEHRVKMIELALKDFSKAKIFGAAEQFSARSGSPPPQAGRDASTAKCDANQNIFANQKIFLSKLEIEQGKPMYAIDTVKLLLKKYPKDNFFWIIGSDNFKTLNKWKSYEELLDLIPFIIVPRTKDNYSSTIIREKVKNGLSIKGLVPHSVNKYIFDKKLYII